MATKKKTTARKVTKKPAVRRTSVARSAPANNFWKIDLNITTVYWLALGIAVIAIAIWTYDTYMVANSVFDQIDQANEIESQTTPSSNPAPAATPAPTEGTTEQAPAY